MIFNLEFLQSHAQHDADRGGTVVVHLPSFILEDEMRETFRGLMEVSRFREILSTAERQMNFNRIIESDKLFAFLQKWWNDKGVAGSCCLLYMVSWNDKFLSNLVRPAQLKNFGRDAGQGSPFTNISASLAQTSAGCRLLFRAGLADGACHIH
jgi:hypothetical protein